MSPTREDLMKISGPTRFGQPGGADPASASAKGNAWSIRNAIRRLAAMEVDFENPIDGATLRKAFGGKVTVAQLVAIKKFQRAIAGKGDVKAMMQLEESIDGKLPTVNLNAGVSLRDLVLGSMEEPEQPEQIEDAESV